METRYKRQGQSWSTEEDKKLYDLTVSGLPIADICHEHQRSLGGIKSRQVRLGLRSDRSSELITPPPPFQPYSRKRKNPAQLAHSDTPRAKPTTPPPPIQPYSEKRKHPSQHAHSGTSRAKLSGSTKPLKTIDQNKLDDIIKDHPNLIERIWVAVEHDIKDIYSSKAASTKHRNAHIVTSRLSPGNTFYELATLQDLGETYGITRERVRQIEEKGQLLLKTRVKARKSLTFGVLNEYRLRNEDQAVNQFYRTLMQEMIASRVTNKFATFVLTAMGRIDGLTSSKIDLFEATFRQVQTEMQRQQKQHIASNKKIESQQEAANRYVAAVLAKSSFSGTFAAEGISLKELPRLRSCEGARELYSKTLGRFVQWESRGERKFIKALDRSSIVTEFAEQPVEIQFVYNGTVRKYYVDLLIKTEDDLTIAVEIKAPTMLADKYVLAKAEAAESIFGQYGIGYCLVDANGRSRLDIQKVKPDEELKAFLRETIRLKKKVDMRDLREFLGEWPSQGISDQIQSLVLRHNLDYRVRLLPDKNTGKVGLAYTFTLSLPDKRGNM